MPKTSRLTYEYVYNYFKEHGCELLSKEYKNNHTPLDYVCSCGNVSKIMFQHFIIGRRCRKCVKERNQLNIKNEIIDYDFVKEFFKYRKCNLLSEECKSDKDMLDFVCACGEKGKITFGAFKRGFLCNNCSGNYTSKNKKYCYDYINYCFKYNGLILLEDNYVSGIHPMKYKCNCGNISEISFSHMMQGIRCRKCSDTRKTNENCYLWEGGLTPLVAYIRDNILKEWKKESIINCEYKCVLTGKDFSDVHHLYSLNQIIKECLSILNFTVKEIDNPLNSYTKNELELIESTCLKLHNKYGLGVCLCRKAHKLFHILYGNLYNTPEQFSEFCIRYRLGEFINIIN